MAKICLCLTGKTLAQDLEILEMYRKYVDLAELRVDCLDSDERFLIRRFPGMAGIPVILTIRRGMDGGRFFGGEGTRITHLAKGLAYADADRRNNFAYVDLEEDLDVPSLEEAARAFGTRIIRSRHNIEGVDDDIPGKLRALRRVGDELVKMVVMPRSLDDVIKVYKAAKETSDIDKILLCTGEYGVNSRILTEKLGSRISYTSPKDFDQIPSAPWQMDPRELAELYRFHKISAETEVFAVSGYPLTDTGSLGFLNTVFRTDQKDAVCIPVLTDSVASLTQFADEAGISGIVITAPYKEDVLPFLSYKSGEVSSIRACNMVVADRHGWMGYNTDAAGFSGSLLSFIGRKDLRHRKLTIIGSGGTARAVAAEVYRLKGKALILNRTQTRARSLAEPYKFVWGALDSRGAELMESYSDIIIQATPVGMYPDTDADPIGFYKFSGREMVMDLIYKPEKTRCLKRAEEAGCRILNGNDMLQSQARSQYALCMKKEFPPPLVSEG